jgi:uncharacterized surface protein with fasciclin (FAS1) repeats
MRSMKKVATGIAIVSALTLTAACGSDDDASADAAGPGTSSGTTDTGDSSSAMDPARDLVGPGCGDYADAVPDGAGSVQGMAQDPVAVAASNNPLLTTLVAAVSGKLNPKVNLVDTLNGGEFTVFAPVDDAFAALPADTVEALKQPKNADLLTTILTYHVVPGQLTPDQVTGSQKSVEGETVKVTGAGDDLKVDDANVICGGVHTANATVYLIDSVLMPKM